MATAVKSGGRAGTFPERACQETITGYSLSDAEDPSPQDGDDQREHREGQRRRVGRR